MEQPAENIKEPAMIHVCLHLSEQQKCRHRPMMCLSLQKTWNSLQRMSMSLQWSLCVCIYQSNTTADMDQWCVWVCREHGPACTEYQRACNDPCVTASIRTRELETSTNDVLAKDQFLSSQVLKWHCIIDVIRSETKANDLTDFLGEQWELPKKPGDDYFCFVSRIKISDSPCHLKTIIKLWKVRSTFKFNPAENYIEKVMKLMYKKIENK